MPFFWHYPLLFIAALLAGGVNALAGGGTFITFPLMTFLGVPAVVANVTNTVALSPGYIGAAWAQAHGLRGQWQRLLRLLLPAVLGGLLGSYLLLHSSEQIFRQIVPFLILAAALLLAVQDRLRQWLLAQQYLSQAHASERWVMLWVGLAAVYGGYFGAGLGVILLAVLGICLHEPLPRLNALKPLISFTINGCSALYFAFSGQVLWDVALLMALGALLGGALGGRLVTRLSVTHLRAAIVGLGVVMAVLYWLR